MDGSHCCVTCGAALKADDGHDLCPACLGLDHLKEALSDNPCMNCSYLPRAVRVARLAQLSSSEGADLPPSGQVPPPVTKHSKRLSDPTTSDAPPKKRKAKSDAGLSSRVEQLSAELDVMRNFFRVHHFDASMADVGMFSPPMPDLAREEDVLSLAASASHFCEEDETLSSRASESGSIESSQSVVDDTEDGSMQNVMREAFTRLRLDIPQPVESGSGNAFFRRGRTPTPFAVPPSQEYLRELHACWRNPGALSRLSDDGRVLAAMQEAAAAGLDCMPAVEPAIASFIVSPEEALRRDVRCPRPQCRVTDELLSKAYNSGARAGRLGNSLAHLLFALSASLQDVNGAAAASSFSDAALQAFAWMTRDLGRVMSYLVQARRQVWLAQSALTESCRRTLRGVPVEPGQMFGSAALEALERTVQARQTRQQLSDLSRVMPPPPPPHRLRSQAPGPSVRPPHRDWATDGRYFQQGRARDSRVASRQPVRRPRASGTGRRPPRPPKGHGARQ